MKDLYVSIFYPHSKLYRICAELLYPLFEALKQSEKKYNYDYFLSAVKGENITIRLSVKQGSINKKTVEYCREMISRFIETYPETGIKEELPPDRIFVNFPVNSVHFWNFRESDPRRYPFTDHNFQGVLKPDIPGLLSMIADQSLAYAAAMPDEADHLYLFNEIINYAGSETSGEQEKAIGLPDSLLRFIYNVSGDQAGSVEAYVKRQYKLQRGKQLNKTTPELTGKVVMLDRVYSIGRHSGTWGQLLGKADGIIGSGPENKTTENWIRIIADISRKISLNKAPLIRAIILSKSI